MAAFGREQPQHSLLQGLIQPRVIWMLVAEALDKGLFKPIGVKVLRLNEARKTAIKCGTLEGYLDSSRCIVYFKQPHRASERRKRGREIERVGMCQDTGINQQLCCSFWFPLKHTLTKKGFSNQKPGSTVGTCTTTTQIPYTTRMLACCTTKRTRASCEEPGYFREPLQ